MTPQERRLQLLDGYSSVYWAVHMVWFVFVYVDLAVFVDFGGGALVRGLFAM